MEVIFVRHGQSEHNLNTRDRLQTIHPHLTAFGEQQMQALGTEIQITINDLCIISPTIRTIESFYQLARDHYSDQVWISPLCGPRMYPQNPDWYTLPCDRILTIEQLCTDYADWRIMNKQSLELWHDAVNTMPHAQFECHARQLLLELKESGSSRAIIISHDGTINHYRELLGEQGLSRDTFLGEAGYYRTTFHEAKDGYD
ncbi:phosphoglycerate mutase family protein [Paenibacillus kandeliae]|uniref:phosphoglycerate mutase family protein n=1 Tax=Paenibacillus kandeliae TaxID=3231269 RepID=UPI00345990B8